MTGHMLRQRSFENWRRWVSKTRSHQPELGLDCHVGLADQVEQRRQTIMERRAKSGSGQDSKSLAQAEQFHDLTLRVSNLET